MVVKFQGYVLMAKDQNYVICWSYKMRRKHELLTENIEKKVHFYKQF